jgi:hypothetical protein
MHQSTTPPRAAVNESPVDLGAAQRWFEPAHERTLGGALKSGAAAHVPRGWSQVVSSCSACLVRGHRSDAYAYCAA